MITTDKTLRAVIYTRVSTDRQAEEGTSLESQQDACRSQARKMGAEVVAAFQDAGTSGDFLKARPGLQEMLSYVEAGLADVVICYALDRLSRNREHQSSLKRRIERLAQLVFCSMQFEKNAAGNLMYGVLGNFAHYQREYILEKTAEGRRARAKGGSQPCRAHSPYGLHVVTKKDAMEHRYTAEQVGSYQIVEEQAAVVRQMFEWYAAGVSLRGVCTRLQAQGVPTPKAALKAHSDRTIPHAWLVSTVYVILTNTVYKGAGRFNRTHRERDEALLETDRKGGHGKKKNPFRDVVHSEEEIITIPAPRIVEPELWELVNQRIKESRATMGGRPDRKHTLSGILRCPRCHLGMRGFVQKTKRPGREDWQGHYYVCRNWRSGSNTAGAHCHPKRYRRDLVEGEVTRCILEVLARPEMVANALRAWEQRQQSAFNEVEYQRIRAEVKDLEAKLRAAATAQIQAIQDGADASLYRQLIAEMSATRRELERQAAAMDQQRSSRNIDPGAVREVVETVLFAVAQVLQSPDALPVERHNALAMVVEDAVPSENGVALRVKGFGELFSSSRHTEQFASVYIYSDGPGTPIRVEVAEPAPCIRAA